jgi:hypothetical protein
MALTIMTVCDGKGAGGTAEYPYQFYAKDSGKAVHVVNLLMPVGGKETGLYRFPQLEERVVVDNDGAPSPTYYLIGYLPGVNNETYNFLSNAKPDPVGHRGYAEAKTEYDTQKEYFETETGALRDAEALVLRYEQTGKAVPENGKDERYSELGFYRKATQWRTADTAYRSVPPARDTARGETESSYSARLVKAGFPKEPGETNAAHIQRISEAPVFPKIDRVNIQSAGDMRAAAKNYQLLKSKRFELLVDCGDTIHTEQELSKDELPLGDNRGDDPVLHAGDAHIRAGNRVVIKAGSAIVLQVGKSVVTISDDGIELKSKLVNSNLTNAYDTTLNLSGQEVSLYGREVKINADSSLGLGDTYGGSFETSLGVVSIGGREIKAESHDSMKYALLVVNAAAQYIQGVTAGSMAVNGKVTNAKMVMGYVKFATDTLNHLSQLMVKLVDVVKTWKEFLSMSKAMRKEKIAQEAEAKAKQAEDDLKAARQAQGEAQIALETAQMNATSTASAYDKAKSDYDAAVKAGNTDPNVLASLKSVSDQAYQRMTMAENAVEEKEERYTDKQEKTAIAQGNYVRAAATSKEEREVAVSAWTAEANKAASKKTPQPPPAPPLPSPPTPPPPRTP